MSRSPAYVLLTGAACVISTAAGVAALDRSLMPHMVGHVLLADVAAASLALAMPLSTRRSIVRLLEAWSIAGGPRGALARASYSPLALLALWTATMTFAMSPLGHRLAMTTPGRVTEAVLLLAVGWLFWRATFDQHSPKPFGAALIRGGLAWWGRHAFAMMGRITIVPAVFMVWYASPASYDGGPADQVGAASVVLAAEMTIFGIAAMLFLALVVYKDPTRNAASHGV